MSTKYISFFDGVNEEFLCMTNKAPMFLFLIYGITGFSLSAKDDLDQISLMNTFDLYLPIPFFREDKIS